MDRSYNPDRRRELMAKRRLNGICTKCDNEAVIGKAYCERCLHHEKERSNSRKAKAKELGNCSGCYKNIAKYGIYCEHCYFKNAARNIGGITDLYSDLWLKLEEQNFKCAYSGIDIKPGINASIDHIIPTALGGSNEIDNLVWCDIRINQMKGDVSLKEFLNLCKRILININNNINYFDIVDNRYKSPRQMWFDFNED